MTGDPTPSGGRLAAVLLAANALKTAPRTGWALRGVASPESVAAHSHGVALVALLLLEIVPQPLDRARALAMAVLHDLPESVTGDLSLGASRLLPAGAKRAAEERALRELLEGTPCAESWLALWRELEDRHTPESRLVRDADRLDLLLQALVYERTTGNRCLEEFFAHAESEPFAFAASREVAAALLRLRG